MNNHRKFKRFESIVRPCKIIINSNGKEIELDGELEDVSQDGAKIKISNKNLSICQKVKLFIGNESSTSMKIVWILDGFIGVQFIEVLDIRNITR